MSDEKSESRLEESVPPAGENLDSDKQQQMEKKAEAEHAHGEEREQHIEEAEKLEEE